VRVDEHLPQVLVLADPAVVKRRRFGNVVLAGARAGLPVEAVRRAAAAAAFPRSAVTSIPGPARPFTDADSMRSPAPPDEIWRVGGGY
jgi:hypothetical protein